MQTVLTHSAAICIGLVGGITQSQVQTWLRNNLDLTKVRAMVYATTVVLESGTLPGLMIILARVDTTTQEFDAKADLFVLMNSILVDFPSLQIFITFPHESRALSA